MVEMLWFLGCCQFPSSSPFLYCQLIQESLFQENNFVIMGRWVLISRKYLKRNCTYTLVSVQFSDCCDCYQDVFFLWTYLYVSENHSVQLFVILWTIQSMEFSRPEYWSGLPFPSPGDLPSPGIEPRSPALQVDTLPIESWTDFSSHLSIKWSRSVVSNSLWPHGL